MFDRQLDAYVAAGAPAMMGVSDAAFRAAAEPLRGLAPESGPGDLAFVLVMPGLPAEQLMPVARQGDKAGYVDMHPVQPEVFQNSAPVPGGPYLLVDVDLGAEFRNVAPRAAAGSIEQRQRLALTIAEGVAIVLLNPGILRERNAFQLMASRDSSKRIPSIWVTREGRPRLGWCFEGVPHSWMGTASAGARLAAQPPPTAASA